METCPLCGAVPVTSERDPFGACACPLPAVPVPRSYLHHRLAESARRLAASATTAWRRRVWEREADRQELAAVAWEEAEEEGQDAAS